MATQRWTLPPNASIKDAMASITAYAEEFVLDAHKMMDEVVQDAAVQQQKYIEEAVTKTGLKRASGNMKPAEAAIIDPLGLGIAGRVRTGEMITSVDSRTETFGNDVVGTWGWPDDKYKEYFQDQEENHGIGGQQGAHSIARSFIFGVRELDRRLDQFVKGNRER